MADIMLDQALSLINAGGWTLLPSHRMRPVMEDQAVTKAEVSRFDDLVLYNGQETAARIGIDRLTFKTLGEDCPRRIYVSGPFMNKQQRKKIEGGGWHEVERYGVRFTLVNRAAEARYEAEEQEKQRQAMIAAKAEAEAAKLRQAEEVSARLRNFFGLQMKKIGNSPVIELTGDDVGITITFENGHKLKIELDFDDIYGYGAHINVEGGGQKIDLETGF